MQIDEGPGLRRVEGPRDATVDLDWAPSSSNSASPQGELGILCRSCTARIEAFRGGRTAFPTWNEFDDHAPRRYSGKPPGGPETRVP